MPCAVPISPAESPSPASASSAPSARTSTPSGTTWSTVDPACRRITRWDPTPYEAQIAGEVNDFDGTQWMDFKAIRRTDRNVVMGVAAAKQALADSGLEVDDENRDDIGVIFGSGGGGPYLLMENHREVGRPRARTVGRPFFIANMLPDTASGQIAIETGHPRLEHVHRHGLLDRHAQHRRGGRGHPPRRLRRGHHRRDREPAPRDGLHRLLEHARHGHAARRASRSRPSRGRSTRRATASCSARASGALMLEDLEYAKARGAQDLRRGRRLRLGGRRVGPHPAGRQGRRRASRHASRRSSATTCPRDEVDLINPHGTSTPLGDLREAQAIWATFGEHTPDIAISGTKSMTGHLMGAAGAIEGVFTVLSVYNQCAPATLNYRDDDPEINLNVVHGGVALDGDPLRDERQHRPRRPQRRGHLQALRRRLIRQALRGAALGLGLAVGLALAVVPAIATGLTPTARSEAATPAVDVVIRRMATSRGSCFGCRTATVVALAARRSAGSVAIRRGVLQDDPSKHASRCRERRVATADGRRGLSRRPLVEPARIAGRGGASAAREPPRRLPSGRPSLRPTTVAVAIASIAPSWAT